MMKAVLFLLVCLAFGARVDAVCPCPRNFDPVCGEDGSTYPNSCVAQCESADIACAGGCPCTPPPGTHSGSDKSSDSSGSSESSESESGEGIMVTEAPTPAACACPFIYDPVCGTNGKQYSNACSAGCEGADVACKGSCPCQPIACICPLSYVPVCGADGVTYGNECGANCASVSVDCQGTCPCQ